MKNEIFFFFTLASQWKLFELLSYGAYNHLFISVICFLKTTHLSVHRFNSLFFFSYRIKSTRIIFLLLKKNIDHGNRVLKTLKIYIWINFSLRNPCCEIDYERAQNWKIARSFCAKVLLRIISIKQFVPWQFLKLLIRKAISKRIFRQRFYFVNLTLWLNYKKTGYSIFIDRCLKPVQIGLFQMPALSFYRNNFA